MGCDVIIESCQFYESVRLDARLVMVLSYHGRTGVVVVLFFLLLLPHPSESLFLFVFIEAGDDNIVNR